MPRRMGRRATCSASGAACPPSTSGKSPTALARRRNGTARLARAVGSVRATWPISHGRWVLQDFQCFAMCRTGHELRETALILLNFAPTLNQRVKGSSPSTPTTRNCLIIIRKIDHQDTVYSVKFGTLLLEFASFAFRSRSRLFGLASDWW